MGFKITKKIKTLQKKAIRLITNSEFISHTNPLFIRIKILKIQDIFKLRLLKLFYKLSYNLLPIYFNRYRETIEQQPARYLRQNIIHPPFIRTAYAECTPLFQLIKLLNYLKADENDQILGKIASKNISYSGFSSHVTFIFLNTYDPICRIKNCSVCRQR